MAAFSWSGAFINAMLPVVMFCRWSKDQHRCVNKQVIVYQHKLLQQE
jgi:hypothetical protein